MSRVRGKNTAPELTVRRLTHGMGYRFRLHVANLPGRPDIVFRSRRRVIFVHGCFWHRHDDPNCKLARMPKSNLDFWGPKLEGNRLRDQRVRDELSRQGWDQLVVWECEVRHTEQVRNKIKSFLEGGEHDDEGH